MPAVFESDVCVIHDMADPNVHARRRASRGCCRSGVERSLTGSNRDRGRTSGPG